MKLTKSMLKRMIKEEISQLKEASDFGSRYPRGGGAGSKPPGGLGSRYDSTPSPNAGRKSAISFPPRVEDPDVEMTGGEAQMSMEEMTQHLKAMGYKIVPIEPSEDEMPDVPSGAEAQDWQKKNWRTLDDLDETN